MNEFEKELKAIFEKARRRDKPRRNLPRYEPAELPPVELFNVRKISLPQGAARVVLWNLPRPLAEWWINARLKPRTGETAAGIKTLVFYDIIPANAAGDELSIYFNKKPLKKPGT